MNLWRVLNLVFAVFVALVPVRPARAETVVLDRSATVELGRFGGAYESEFSWRAPHFMRQVRIELAALLCGQGPPPCPAVGAGDRVVISTLDWEMQKLAERTVHEAVFGGHDAFSIHNGALEALDYRTGEVLAWVGSAGFGDPPSAAFQPQFDVLADGWRQPASAFKPFAYLAGLETGALTAATPLNDVATEFEPGFTPRNADHQEHGHVLLREALRHSFNIPAVEASLRAGLDAVRAVAARFGLAEEPGAPDPGLAAALGVTERHPADMLSAYGALANGGNLVRRHFIVRIAENGGSGLAPDPDTRQVCSAEGAFLVTNLLASDRVPGPGDHTAWALRSGDGVRPVALKSGTSNDARDMHAYGYLAPPSTSTLPALAVGVWLGNSDDSPAGDTRAAETAVPLWRTFVTAVSRDWPAAPFGPPPAGVVKVKIDPATGVRADARTERPVDEWFLRGTEPGSGADTVAAAPP